MDDAGTAALSYYQDNYFESANATQLLVFDIDETTLSNLEYNMQTGYGADGTDEQWSTWVASAASPAIEATLKVYKAAYASGMSVRAPVFLCWLKYC